MSSLLYQENDLHRSSIHITLSIAKNKAEVHIQLRHEELLMQFLKEEEEENAINWITITGD